MKNCKSKILCFILTIGSIILWNSCSDWLNLKPYDGVPRDEYWKTKEDVNSAVVGAYISLTNSDLITRMFLYGEWRADLIQSNTRKKNAEVQSVVDGEISSDNSFLNWYRFYQTINACNTVLKYAPDAQKNDPSFTPASLKEYEAQAMAIRSLMYFYLVRSFGDVPLSLEAYVDNSQEMALAKTSKEAILDTLVQNLKYAEQYIPYKYSNMDVARNKGKMTIWAVKALLADIYLWQENYDMCNSLCDEIINSGQFALIPVRRDMIVSERSMGELNDTIYYPNEGDINSLYDKLYFEGNSVESIFEIQFSTDNLNPFYNMMSMSNGYLQANTVNLSDEIFIPTAKNDNNYYDIREMLCQNKGYIWKYSGIAPGGAERAQSDFTANYIIYRLPEIYLMKAEALVQMGIRDNENQDLFKQALNCIDKVRVRANAVESTDPTYKQITYEGKTLEHFVLEERAREFAFEGKRWFDVLRQAKRNNYEGDNLNYLLNLAVYSTSPDKVYSLQNKYKNVKSHYLPIYSNELETNKLLKQNEFYQEK